ncbi:hypothetical protein J5N97_024980 [Dioscorea zingiberensis]|uniref:Secreted protein n=1 Tax=Dioscorea zingiberensis TaxID=325984 RepID=A0A9D5C846_9LILI|nr:hypothetical protein J5N97_024980 [Dioscorea zingiberensis]
MPPSYLSSVAILYATFCLACNRCVVVKTEPEVVVNNEATRLRGSDVIQSWNYVETLLVEQCGYLQHI